MKRYLFVYQEWIESEDEIEARVEFKERMRKARNKDVDLWDTEEILEENK